MGKFTIQKIITQVDSVGGAPMGRSNVGTRPTDGTRVYDSRVPMITGGYDRGGAYWGLGPELRVSYTKDLAYIEFYRMDDSHRYLNWIHKFWVEHPEHTLLFDRDQCDLYGQRLLAFRSYTPNGLILLDHRTGGNIPKEYNELREEDLLSVYLTFREHTYLLTCPD